MIITEYKYLQDVAGISDFLVYQMDSGMSQFYNISLSDSYLLSFRKTIRPSFSPFRFCT